MKKILFVFVIIIIPIIGILAWQISQRSPTANVKDQQFNLYVVKTDKDKEIGLSKYDKIDENRGMLFTFNKSDYYSFWMKKMKFSIDIIFIKDNKVVTIYENASPPKNEKNLTLYTPLEPADTVLEVKAGISQKYKLEKGDTITFSNI